MGNSAGRNETPASAQWSVRSALLLVGFSAVTAQVVLMRELVVVFYGNELSLGLMLASWFFWTALGSGILGRARVAAWHARGITAALQCVLALAFPLSIVAVRLARSAYQTLPGELLGPGAMLAVSFAVLSAFCLVSGWLFAAGSRLYAESTGIGIAGATSALYLVEAIGSGIGGFLTGLLLVPSLTPFQIATLLALLNVASAAALIPRKTLRWLPGIAVFLVAFGIGAFRYAVPWLEARTLGSLWRGFHLLAVRNSIYGNLVVVGTEGSRSLYENGLVVATAPDPAAAEEAVHYALLQHPSPRSLLLIGGGLNGSISQALQHTGVSRLDYVELDPAILDIAREFFPSEAASIARDSRVRVRTADGRQFLKAAGPSFDVIVVNLPDPQTAQLNRFYTVEFFEEASRRLNPGGVFSIRLSGAENYLSPQLGEFLGCIRKSLSEAFADVVAMPGDPVHFFAAARSGYLTRNPEVLVERLRARQLRTSYVREYYIPFRITPDRLLDLEQQTAPRPESGVNRDFSPIAYYFDTALWSARFSPVQSSWFQRLAAVGFGGLTTGLGLLIFAVAGLLFRIRHTGARLSATAGYCVVAMGFTMIASEILLLLAFQSLYGYVYQQLSIIIAAFMAGLALGSRSAQVRLDRSYAAASVEQGMGSLARLQAIAAVSPVLLVILFRVLEHIHEPAALWLVSRILFPAVALACGFLGGYQFPRASRIFFARAKPTAGPGGLYALDLAGSCSGAVVLSVYFIPVFGFLKTAALVGLMNLAPLALALRSGILNRQSSIVNRQS